MLRSLVGSEMCIRDSLDLSSAFDTVDHQILLDILERRFAITDAALSWFHSYLSDRSYRTYQWQYIERHRTGLWSASGLGAWPQDVHSLYGRRLPSTIDSIFTHHDVHHHAFADDTQTYLAVTRHNGPTVAPRLTELSKRHK